MPVVGFLRKRRFCLPVLFLSLAAAEPPKQGQCPSAGVISLRTPLNVNPDGSTGSYSRGDHGYTYIANGLNLVQNGRTIFCSSSRENSRLCRQQFRQAEAMDFGPGSPTFCVFALVADPYRPGVQPPSCDPRRPERRLIGGGQGRPRLGPNLPTIDGGSSATYASTSSLRHMVGGTGVYLDAAAVPVLVTPDSSQLGAIAWLRYRGRSTFAILGDSGRSYGEGSIALHQRLLYDGQPPPQPLGPIPRARRCGPLEAGLRAPFTSRPDSGDECRAGHSPRNESDIRAYRNIEEPVDLVILTGVRPPMRGRSLVLGEVTPQWLEALALEAGFSPARLAEIADCRRR
jgi:hypothetical protein